MKKGYRKERKGLTAEQQDVFRQAFEIFDSNHSNNIDESQLADLMRSLGFKYSNERIKEIMQEVDRDGSGVIEVGEFIDFMKKHIVRTILKKIDDHNIRREIEKVFHHFDDDNTGYIDFRKLKAVSSQCCCNIDDQTIRKMIEAADMDGDGKVSKYEFMRVMKKMKLV